MNDERCTCGSRFLNESKENKNTQKRRNETNAFGSLLPQFPSLEMMATLDIMLLNLLSKVALAVGTHIEVPPISFFITLRNGKKN